eukprot:2401936-Ditylum_brightwellii.AAC.1
MEKLRAEQDEKGELHKADQDQCHDEMMMMLAVVTQEQDKDKSIPKKVEVRTESPAQHIEEIEDRNDNDE